MSDHKKTFIADKIRTSEICGIDGSLLIHSTTSQTISSLSGHFITGQHLGISGDIVSISGHEIEITDNGGEGSIDLKSGDFEHLTVNGVKYIPKEHLVYAFRFGGPLTDVPNGLPRITGSSPEIFNGLAAGQNVVFVEDTGIFVSGDQIVINPGGYYEPQSDLQEEHVVTGISYYEPDYCCNVTLTSSASNGQSFVLHNKEDVISAGHKVKFSGHSTLYTVESVQDQGGSIDRINITPNLQNNLLDDHCACIIQPALFTKENLFNDYPEGTKVARKYARTTTTLAGCNSSGDISLDKVDLLIQSNDFDGSTLISDSSPSGRTVMVSGDTHHNTEVYKFAESSIKFDGTGDYISIPDYDFDFGTDPFTIETWFYVDNLPSTYDMPIMAKGDGGADNESTFQMAIGGPADTGGGAAQGTHAAGKMIIARLFNDNASYIYSNTVLSENTWYHVAVVREGSGSGQVKLYINGALDSSWTKTNSTHANSHPLLIGTMKWNGAIPSASTQEFDGYLEDIRITKGVARYTSNFSVPSENFSSLECTSINHCDSTCSDATHLYLDVGTYSGLGPSWANGLGENEPAWDWYLTGYRDHFIDFAGIDVHATGNNIHGILTLAYPDKGI